MRTIKFRGKDTDDGEWVVGNLIGGNRIVGEIVEWNDEYFCTEFWYTVDPETVGQYSGLKDKNGVEIYEGDIAVHDGSCGSIVSQTYGFPNKYGTGEAFVFKNIDCGLVARHVSSYGNSSFDIPNSIIKGWRIIETYQLWNLQRGFEVIGNIYSNADLLPQASDSTAPPSVSDSRKGV